MKGFFIMKRMLIFSDTHGVIDRCIDVIEKIGRVDVIVHAGDYVRDVENLELMFPNIPIHYVKGNNDLFSRGPSEEIFMFGDKKIFVTHGHIYGVKMEIKYTTLVEKAKKEDVDMCIFGHTHIPYLANEGKITVLNPGSVTYSNSYAVAEWEDGKLSSSIIELS